MLRSTSQALQALLDAAPLAIYTIDADGLVGSWNRAAEEMFGWSSAEVVGQLLPIVRPGGHGEFRRSLRDAFAHGQTFKGLQLQGCRRDGVLLDLRLCFAPVPAHEGGIQGLITIAEDVTERKNIGEQLRQAQKMEAVGQLTAGIAHDFNNILTVVATNATLLRENLPANVSEMITQVSEVQCAANRGAELVRKLMAFTRQRPIELKPIDVGNVVAEVERAIRRLLPESVQVSSGVHGGPLVIRGDIGAIEQILFNLATNARDAMPDGGTLRLAVYRGSLEKGRTGTESAEKAGEYVVISVADTGCGMSPDTQARIFEPFFSTKPPGKGTGLGMAMVYGIVKQHDGHITLDTVLGEGTTFKLHFPALNVGAHNVVAEAQASPPPVGGSERILIVDDDDAVRRSAARVLKRYGYSIEEAATGEQAVERLNRHGGGFDLILTDLIMPGMGGLAVYEEIYKRGNSSRVLLMSGYTAEELDPRKGPWPGLRFLHKPWAMNDLLRSVRCILDEPA